jgi:hypothetical protein
MALVNNAVWDDPWILVSMQHPTPGGTDGISYSDSSRRSEDPSTYSTYRSLISQGTDLRPALKAACTAHPLIKIMLTKASIIHRHAERSLFP